ncbi:hypothetical protein SUBVAR_06839 [Subdoligranulum variabile DSM 15176]|uniref:Uncharacterized protein n=1 Tax=Subdoligranulum variabile DSM 15176 TaxID=411471 RepID=D1PR13_9FIRM|nr:hypothetical protein SUBVAR_06839 [Subdoligranulum variabile DSM 15176]
MLPFHRFLFCIPPWGIYIIYPQWVSVNALGSIFPKNSRPQKGRVWFIPAGRPTKSLPGLLK